MKPSSARGGPLSPFLRWSSDPPTDTLDPCPEVVERREHIGGLPHAAPDPLGHLGQDPSSDKRIDGSLRSGLRHPQPGGDVSRIHDRLSGEVIDQPPDCRVRAGTDATPVVLPHAV